MKPDGMGLGRDRISILDPPEEVRNRNNFRLNKKSKFIVLIKVSLFVATLPVFSDFIGYVCLLMCCSWPAIMLFDNVK